MKVTLQQNERGDFTPARLDLATGPEHGWQTNDFYFLSALADAARATGQHYWDARIKSVETIYGSDNMDVKALDQGESKLAAAQSIPDWEAKIALYNKVLDEDRAYENSMTIEGEAAKIVYGGIMYGLKIRDQDGLRPGMDELLSRIEYSKPGTPNAGETLRAAQITIA